MKGFLFAFLILMSHTIIGQDDIAQIQKEIDRTVWRLFQNAFESLDAEALNNLYANDVIRVANDILDTDEVFKAKNIERFSVSKTNGVEIKLDFWFDSRSTNNNTSYEVGFFRINSSYSGETHSNYGQFHILLEKIEGLWKITQDWDTTKLNGKLINASDFNRKDPQIF